MMRLRTLLPLILASIGQGCTASHSELYGKEDPSRQIPEMKKAAREHDLRLARKMVGDLESDDPALRFYAIHALERLTGERYGYQYFADEEQRKAAVERWRQWLAAQESGAPASRPSARAASL